MSTDPRAEWLLCPDCSSSVHEVFYGEPPNLTLSIQVDHSPTCPVWHADGREVMIAIMPPKKPETTPKEIR